MAIVSRGFRGRPSEGGGRVPPGQYLVEDFPCCRRVLCVTKWSKLDTSWAGVPLDVLFEDVETAAEYALIYSYGGCTTNLPLDDLLDGQAWTAHRFDGEELAPVHGGPAQAGGPVPRMRGGGAALGARSRHGVARSSRRRLPARVPAGLTDVAQGCARVGAGSFRGHSATEAALWRGPR
ncbi:molybdopterin-dependent oxidoreductase-like protein [Nonomuraea polychroma]|uniref:Molybdopterin-dependent oxidoreductase-like protein n=1 Tax=Nonomuraea polychroma TaxID=46176 RepID=A0A438M6W3_9ACTN|nr:molybdopterin-dependent oxidoreductase-like protein [Nonomuraea polychroma]